MLIGTDIRKIHTSLSQYCYKLWRALMSWSKVLSMGKKLKLLLAMWFGDVWWVMLSKSSKWMNEQSWALANEAVYEDVYMYQIGHSFVQTSCRQCFAAKRIDGVVLQMWQSVKMMMIGNDEHVEEDTNESVLLGVCPTIDESIVRNWWNMYPRLFTMCLRSRRYRPYKTHFIYNDSATMQTHLRNGICSGGGGGLVLVNSCVEIVLCSKCHQECNVIPAVVWFTVVGGNANAWSRSCR